MPGVGWCATSAPYGLQRRRERERAEGKEVTEENLGFPLFIYPSAAAATRSVVRHASLPRGGNGGKPLGFPVRNRQTFRLASSLAQRASRLAKTECRRPS